MQHHVSQRIVLRIIASGFLLTSILNFASLAFPPDMSQNPPVYPAMTLLLQSFALAILIFASTVYGIRLAEEKMTLAAAGFTMYAIANGIGIVIFFEMRHFTSEEYEKIYEIMGVATMLVVPSCALMGFCTDFPRWIRWAPLGTGLIMLLPTILYYAGDRQFNVLDQISFAGYMLQQIVQIFWAVLLFRMARHVHA